MPGESREAGEAGLGAMSPAEAFTLLISSPSRTRTGDRASRLRRHQNHQTVTSGRPGNAAAQGELGVPVQEYRGPDGTRQVQHKCLSSNSTHKRQRAGVMFQGPSR